MFPLLAKTGGVLERTGHTEGSIDLMKMAKLKSAAIICKIMNPDGTMARQSELAKFAEAHNLPIISIHEIIQYRLKNETLIKHAAQSVIPTSKYEAAEAVIKMIGIRANLPNL